MRNEKKIVIVGFTFLLAVVPTTGYLIYTTLQSNSILTEQTTPLQTELEEQQHLLESLNTEWTQLRDQILQRSEELNNTLDELALRQTATRYTVHNPLYWEARDFLINDTTDLTQFNETTFNTAHYAQEVNNNAEKRGIRCAYVKVTFSDSNQTHALIAFETTDRGLNFFEPQTDEKVNLQVGKNYWRDCVIPTWGMTYAVVPGYTIESFTVYW
jgi:hypothetical protein